MKKVRKKFSIHQLIGMVTDFDIKQAMLSETAKHNSDWDVVRYYQYDSLSCENNINDWVRFTWSWDYTKKGENYWKDICKNYVNLTGPERYEGDDLCSSNDDLVVSRSSIKGNVITI
jgi:hypothetical protein